jgi:hypothetical protein
MAGKQKANASAVTRPRRRFTPKNLAELSRTQRRKLAQVLLTEGGARVIEYNHPAAYDEFVLEVAPLWRLRRIRARVMASSIDQGDVDGLAERVAESGNAEGILLATQDAELPDLALPENVSAIGGSAIVSRLERSALVAWAEQKPLPSYELLAAQRTLDRDAAFLDPVGIRWLPILALNELPLDLQDGDLPPQDALERVAFRLFTSVFRLGGERYGESMRGQRLPDALLTFRAQDTTLVGALLDCKAAASGYTMDADHELRFHQYVTNLSPELAERGVDLRFVVVLSSAFPGRSGARHPFRARHRKLQSDLGVGLVYLRAVDLARTAVAVLSAELAPAAREALDWETPFKAGLVTAPDLEQMLEEAA